MATVAIYRAIMLEVERRRLAVGISMEQMSELTGAAERSYAKMLYADTASGRVAQWQTLQAVVDVLFHDGFELQMKPTSNGMLTTAGTKRKIMAEAATWNRSIRREMMAELGRRGHVAFMAKVPAWKRSQNARKAARARWNKTKRVAPAGLKGHTQVEEMVAA